MGFRYHTAWRKDRVVSLIATDETLQYVYDDAVTLGEQPYGIARGTRRLMPLTERLHPAALWHCVEEPAVTPGRGCVAVKSLTAYVH